MGSIKSRLGFVLQKIMRIKILCITLFHLGLINIVRVFNYRFLLKTKYFHRKLEIKKFQEGGPFFSEDFISFIPEKLSSGEKYISNADNLINGTMIFFSHFNYKFELIPDWSYDPFQQIVHKCSTHWAEIDEFSFKGSDVKILWELSRFSWAPTFAQAYVLTNDKKYLDTLNSWINDWCMQNPANQGIQWKCGQETSIRLLHFLTSLLILSKTDTMNVRAIEFIERHLERIFPTTSYAKAQRNNHATSEAAALYIGGACLLNLNNISTKQRKRAQKYHSKGKKLLQWATTSLIYSDGSFSQHSVIYHRVMLDTLTFCEFWRRRLNLPKLNNEFYCQAQKATDWLFSFVDGKSGDSPNLGGNDGAHLFNLSQSPYRNFKPTVQLASMMFFDKAPYPPGAWNDQLKWLQVPINYEEKIRKTVISSSFEKDFEEYKPKINIKNFEKFNQYMGYLKEQNLVRIGSIQINKDKELTDLIDKETKKVNKKLKEASLYFYI